MKHVKAVVGYGTWDSWGFGVSYCHYNHCFGIEFIHWYVYIEFWKEK